MAKVKAWYSDFTANWSVKACGSKPSVDLLDAGAVLGAAVRKRPGFETFAATLALRDCGVTMPQYKNATGAASAAINTVGSNERNPFMRAKLVQAQQTRNEAGDTVYAMRLTARGVAVVKAALPANRLDGIAVVEVKPATLPAKPPRRPAKPAAPAAPAAPDSNGA